jgi:hypothetical protein
MVLFSNVGLLSLLLLLVAPLATDSRALPDGFTVGPGVSGAELVWSSTNQQVRMGSSRYEFRLASGGVLGYPREIEGKLVLTMSSTEQDLLATDGQDLEVWLSGRPLNSGAFAGASGASGASGADASYSVTTPTVPVDPAALGTEATQRMSYTLTELQLDEYPFPLEVVGEVTQPEQLQSAVKYPLILFLHGRHGTCYEGGPDGFDSGDWPCPDGWLPIPSHEGYRYVADSLASQGYVVVSISANGINGQDYASMDGGAAARSILIRHHLTMWAQWNTVGDDPWSSRFLGKLDMNKVVLVGHSRGGEGVHRAAIDASSSDPFNIVGLVTYGPTAFGRQVTPDVHSATILPTCDGDVSDLQGQAYVDASRDIAYSEALRSGVIALGCNHNFFNTEWTPGLAKAPSFDDWYDSSDPVCGSEGGSVRLTPQEQQVVGAAYTVALVRLAVKQDEAMLQLLDGSFVRPEAIGRADVAVSAVGGAANRLLYRPEDEGVVRLRKGMTGDECLGYFQSYFFNSTLPVCGDYEFDSYTTPHWQPRYYEATRPAPQAMELIWTNNGAEAHFTVPVDFTNLTSLDWVDVRVANDPNLDGARLKLLVVDKSGRNATLVTSLSTVDGWPGTGILDRVHARTLRGSLASVQSKVDLNNIVAVVLVAHSPDGRVWVIDVAASQARIQQPVVLNLPVISVENVFVQEGDGMNTVNLKITADQPLKSPGSIWVQTSYYEGYQIDIAAGSTTVVANFSYSWIGDNFYSDYSFESESVAVGAVEGVVTGNYIGGVIVVEDDPAPTLSVDATEVTAVEGMSLEWQLNLSTPTTGTSFYFYFVPPRGTELTSNDVPDSWFQAQGVSPPSTPMPLSSIVFLYARVDFAYGVKSAQLILPLVTDGTAEGNEMVMIEGYDSQGELLVLVGTVSKHG